MLVSTMSFASDCLVKLEQLIIDNPNLSVVGVVNYYDCDQACALTFEHDSSPYPNTALLAFLDVEKNILIPHSVIQNNRAFGHENFDKRKISYLDATFKNNSSLLINISIETPRDAIFWPPHKVYFKKSLTCNVSSEI